MCGQIAYDWNTMPMSRRSGGRLMPRAADRMVTPPNEISPASARSRPAMMRSVVDFPQPLGPSKVTTCPLGMSKVTSSSARTLPNALLSPEMRMSGSDAAGRNGDAGLDATGSITRPPSILADLFRVGIALFGHRLPDRLLGD